MYELIVKIDGEEYSSGEFYSKRKALMHLEWLYEKEEIANDVEAWIE